MVKFVHFKKFDSSQCVRRFPDMGFVIHAWPIMEKDLDKYLEVYADGDPVVFGWDDVSQDMDVFAADYRAVDEYVCGRSDVVPELFRVDAPEDLVRFACIRTTKEILCHCGCGMVQKENDAWFENPYQIVIMPKSTTNVGLWIYDKDDRQIGGIFKSSDGTFSVDTYRPDFSNYQIHTTYSFFDAWQIAKKTGGVLV